MKNKLDSKLVVLAAGATAAIVYIACAAAYLLLPKQTFDVFWKPMFHWLYGASGWSMVLGLVETMAYTILTVAVFVLVYNYLLGKEKG